MVHQLEDVPMSNIETMISQFQSEFDRFLSSAYRNEWLYLDHASVYVRKSERYFNGIVYKCLDMANITIDDDNDKGHGFLKAVLSHMESKGLPVYVECIMHEWLVDKVEKYGYNIIRELHDTHGIKFGA